MNNDLIYMKRAIKLAYKGSGYVNPNPKVGAVIVKNDEIVGEGWHTAYGKPHAEVEAVKNAGINDFSGCIMYVNLEPCSHYGKTPPCAKMLVEKNFKKVVIGTKDPNPLVAGKGIEILKNAGIDVLTGILEEEAKWINRFFIKYIKTNNPYVILKAAQSIDGKIALSDYNSKWITNAQSRKEVHKLRAEIDAILVGKNTIIHDNPNLNVRNVKGRNPKRIILDSNLSLDLNYNIFTDNFIENTIICYNEKSRRNAQLIKLQELGISLVPIRGDEYGRINISNLLHIISANFQISSILVEGGSQVFSTFIENQLVDELQIFIAPKILGNGISSFGNLNIKSITESFKYHLKSIKKFDDDIRLIYLEKQL